MAGAGVPDPTGGIGQIGPIGDPGVGGAPGGTPPGAGIRDLVPDLIAGGINLIGQIGNTAAARATNRQALEHAERMYRNRYQWTVRDMIAAGLNPMLAAGTQPVGSTPHLQDQFSERLAAEGADSARGFQSRKLQRDLLASQIQKNMADAELAAQMKVRTVKEGNVADEHVENLRALTGRALAEKLKLMAETREIGPRVLGTQIPRIDLNEFLDQLNNFNSSAKDIRRRFIKE